MLLNNKYEYNPKTDLLGIGGFGRVYKAKDTLLERDVALKMVNIEGAKAHYSLIEEIKKAINLQHPNIIRYFDVFNLLGTGPSGEEINTQVGVMEYIPYGDISQLDWNNLPQEQQKDILLQILDGLGYLHQNKIIHRDIKPSNILINKEGDRIIPKITDFGISKSQDAASVSVSRVIGSIPYMAPEQFDSKGRVSYNTDFWSLGILVYRLFTGNLPFGDESTTSEGVIMKNIMEAPMPQEVQQIPLPFRTLVELCLVKNRAERVKDAEVLMEVLQQGQKAEKYKPGDTQPPLKGTQPEEPARPRDEETTRAFAHQPESKKRYSSSNERPAGQPTDISSQKAISTPPKSNRKTVYQIMGLAALLMIMVVLGMPHFAGGKKELAATETTELSTSEAGFDTTQQQARLTAEREAEEQVHIEAERRVEQQRQREEQARIEAEHRAEEQRRREEEARRLVDSFHDQMVFVRGGTFTMGCTSEQENDCYGAESPTFQATVSDYYIGKYPVTQQQWRAIMGNNPSTNSGCDDCPVTNVSWNDTREFILKLNQKTGKRYRLPTEAEWEFAARGGTQSSGFKYSGSNNICDVAWYRENSGGKTQPLGRKRANELGIHDMSGNVWEWCSDWYGSFTATAKTNPTGPAAGSIRVGRGGSWNNDARSCRVSNRNGYYPDYHNSYIGFRLVLVP